MFVSFLGILTHHHFLPSLSSLPFLPADTLVFSCHQCSLDHNRCVPLVVPCALLCPGYTNDLFDLPDGIIDLSTVTSPYSGSTIGNSDDVAVCGQGADEGFGALLAPGSTITVRQTSNTFDSRHTLRHGGVYPGDVVVACVDDPDTNAMSYTNYGDFIVPVYFIIDAYSSSGAGDFVLVWSGDFVSGGEFSNLFSC